MLDKPCVRSYPGEASGAGPSKIQCVPSLFRLYVELTPAGAGSPRRWGQGAPARRQGSLRHHPAFPAVLRLLKGKGG